MNYYDFANASNKKTAVYQAISTKFMKKIDNISKLFIKTQEFIITLAKRVDFLQIPIM